MIKEIIGSGPFVNVSSGATSLLTIALDNLENAKHQLRAIILLSKEHNESTS